MLPACGKINVSESDRLPFSGAMTDTQGRMPDLWEHTKVGSAREVQIFMETRYSLPGIIDGRPELDDVFLATMHQRACLRQDQQLVQWEVLRR